MPKEPRCTVCDAPLGNLAPPHKLYCSRACRDKRYNLRKKAKKAAERKKHKPNTAVSLTPAMREFRMLLDEQDPFVRETLQQAIRDVVTEAVADNLVGAGEIITGLLPKTLAGLAVDLDSEDWMIRSRAQQAVLKYSMEFRNKETKDVDLGTINVIHNVALPGTPLGKAVAGEIETIDAEAGSVIEYFEKDWPTCDKCGDRKHPDTIYDEPDGAQWCSSCHLSAAYKNNETVESAEENNAV